ncbi:MAG: efflux RND transporter periplasmic adaptor subunit [Deltaproteobacteria bacterium]|nr:efflux RND transporter periplasmic adaptor subunit [Deltaproteobacteria bacterium]MBW2470011.1 efflux RND transporter periplasmic adaptor subunit [Deltaproteobacteria bacterium]
MKKRLILIAFLVLLLGVGGLVYWGQRQERLSELYYSGTIEATQADLAFQVSGRVQAVFFDEGQAVAKNQVLAVLDQQEFEARRAQARSDRMRFQENLKQLETLLELNRKILPAEVERVEASVKALQSQLAELEAGYRVQEVEQARYAYEQAQFALEEARRDKIRYDRLFERRIISENDKETTDLKYETALKEYERAQKAYELRKEGYRKESIETARSKLVEGQATLKQARENLKKIDAIESEVEAAKAQVQAAKAAFELTEIQLKYTELTAPFKGILVSRNVEPGEVVSPGQEVLSLSDLSQVDLKIFVAETEIGKVRPGQPVDVKIDTFPGKIYHGMVSFISPEGEFTPKIIQTHKERVKLVYLVKIKIPNPNIELKPGMPADAWLK